MPDIKVIEFPKANKVANDTAASLRSLADAVERGDIDSLVMAFTERGEYEIRLFSSLVDSVVLTSLLHDAVVRGFRNG